MASRLKACWDVIDLLRSAANHTSVLAAVLVSQSGGRDIVHILWNWCVLVAGQELAWWRLFGSEVWRHIVGLLLDRMWVSDISADGWGEVVDLRTQKEVLNTLTEQPEATRLRGEQNITVC